ncbi:MAG TPA: DNA gyrase inhibitor YacG [Blastocatellia bacterium]|nr:DNA gyrase inhibitor YacG [Blastocatellia bacterium]
MRLKREEFIIRTCPLCHQEAAWADNPWRPFCSERCQLLDLGRWANEEYRVASADMPARWAVDPNDEVVSDEQV